MNLFFNLVIIASILGYISIGVDFLHETLEEEIVKLNSKFLTILLRFLVIILWLPICIVVLIIWPLIKFWNAIFGE